MVWLQNIFGPGRVVHPRAHWNTGLCPGNFQEIFPFPYKETKIVPEFPGDFPGRFWGSYKNANHKFAPIVDIV